jgi:tyrosyl-tRNA synthetase
LYRKYNCTLQFGGSDQWANILGGVDLIRRTESKEVYAVTLPLIARSDGKKMGKSESGAIWLDITKTNVYDFYQYWINVPDQDVDRFLKVFTFLEVKEIDLLTKENIINAKKVLAYEVTKFVHGEELALVTKEQSEKIFEKGDIENAPLVEVDKSLFSQEKINLLDILTSAQVTASKGKARELIVAGGVYVNEVRVTSTEIDKSVIEKDFVIRVGKKKYYKIISV